MLKKIKKFIDRTFIPGMCLGLIAAAIAARLPGGAPSEHELMAKVVRLTSENGKGSCSGEQVRAPSGEDYILTAAHCLSLAANGAVQVISEDGRSMSRRVIAEDPTSDLAIIEGLPKTAGLAIGKFTYRNQEVRTFTHGKGLATYKTAGVLIEEQEIFVLVDTITSEESRARCASKSKYSVESIFIFEVCVLKSTQMATTASVVPGSSGGMVVNEAGALVGVVSAGGEGMGWLVTLNDIHRFLSNY